MVQDRNQFITTMKSEIYRKEYRNDTQRVDMQTQLIHKDKLISSLEVSTSTAAVCGSNGVLHVLMQAEVLRHSKTILERRRRSVLLCVCVCVCV